MYRVAAGSLIFGFSTLFCLVLYPATATAGVFDWFFKDDAEASSRGNSSVQTMSILKAAMNHNPNPAKGGGEIVIEDASAVAAQGPFVGETVMPQKDAISLYVVKEGDTLSEIADLFGVTVNTIIWANDLPSSGSIRPGQMLTILPVSGVRYQVKKGDTLALVAKQFKGDADEIAQFNGISNGTLAVGTEIIIPNGKEAFEPAPAPVKTAGGGQTSPSYAGYYTNPLPSGRRTQGIHGTNGVDLAVAGASRPPIVAAASGEVIIAFEGGWNGGYGSYVVIKHSNGTQTLYAHMSSVTVGKGQYVNQGQVIGYVGSTGRSSGPHLHFEIRGGPRNPF